MPSELQRVAQGLLECIDQMPDVAASLQRRAVRLRELAGQVADMRGGANSAALELEAAAQACERAADIVARVPPKARAWAEQMVSGGRTAGGSVGQGGGPISGSLQVRRLSGQELLDKLPERRPTPGYRPKTQGLWQDRDGEPQKLISGEHDEDYRHARAFAWRLGLLPRGVTLPTASHVELKFAMRMWREGIRNAVIAVNKRPCDDVQDVSCDDLLERFLPPGARLTIHGPDGFEKTYENPEKS